MNRTLVDTNILVYAALEEQGKKHKIAADEISSLILGKQMAVSIQNLAELSRVLLEKTKPAPEPGNFKRVLFGYSRCAQVLSYSEFSLVNAASIKDRQGLHFFDALLVATMEENNISNILTENTRDFESITWINAVNPFKKG